MEKIFTLNDKERLQIKLSSGFDAKLVAASLRLSPILIRVTGISQTNGNCSLILSLPTGMTVAALKESEKNAPYWADTWTDHYSRLSLTRRVRNAAFIIGNDDNEILENDLLDTLDAPIVIEPFFGKTEENIVFQLRFAANKSWNIKREEHTDLQLASDPTSVPAIILDLFDLITYPIPAEENELHFLSLRIKNIDDLLQWYSRKILSEAARETITLKLAQLKDYSIQLEMMKEKLDPKIITTLGSVKYADKTKNDIEPVVEFISEFSNLPGFKMLNSAFADENLPDLPIHNCNKCQSHGELRQKFIITNEGRKQLSFVTCSECEFMIPRSDWGDRNQAISVWNKLNGEAFLRSEIPTHFGFEGLDNSKIRAELKNVNKLIIEVRSMINDLHPEDKRNFEMNGLNERLLKITMWSTYIRKLLAQDERAKQKT